LYNEQVNKLINEGKYNKEEVMELAKKFVSFPSKDPFKPFVHSTGGAIDLTIINENNEELNMGTEFDDFTDMAATDFFENSFNDEIKKNRRLLFGILTKVGFTNLPSEWWHYDYGDSFWAATNRYAESYYSGIYNFT
jgi:D-alanyl-D-alanine dipeptidase